MFEVKVTSEEADRILSALNDWKLDDDAEPTREDAAMALRKFVIRIASKENPTPAELEAMTRVFAISNEYA